MLPKHLLLTLLISLLFQLGPAVANSEHTTADLREQIAARGSQAKPPAGQPYPQFRSAYGVIRWIPDQMPLKVYVAHGQTLDGIMDEEMGAPSCNVDNLARWPDVVANLMQESGQDDGKDGGAIAHLPIAQGYSEEQYQAAIQGISMWKSFEKEGLFSFTFTNDPLEADIYVFFVHHFVNKMGLALFAQDIRGYTAKRSFPLKAVLNGQNAEFRPVVVQLRTTDVNGTTLPFAKMRASAAHEFGHCLGIDQHSTNPYDLMSLYYGNGVISPNDAATIRYLYHMTPDLIP